MTGITRVRLSDFECKKSTPTPVEQEQLCLALNIPKRLLGAACPRSKRPSLPHLARWSRFEVLKDRPNEARWYSASRSYPDFMRKAEARLQSRKDIEWIRVYFRETRFDSYLELMFSLHLLLDGAKPGWLSPQSSGFDLQPVVDPVTKRLVGHFPHPALSWNQMTMFPQLTIRGKKLTARLDVLAGIKNGSKVKWVNLELDGEGHDSRRDHEREYGLEIAVARFSTSQITSGAFLAELQEPWDKCA